MEAICVMRNYFWKQDVNKHSQQIFHFSVYCYNSLFLILIIYIYYYLIYFKSIIKKIAIYNESQSKFGSVLKIE